MIFFSNKDSKGLFDGRRVSAQLPYGGLEDQQEAIREGNGRLSISGAQEKYAMVEDHGLLRLTGKDEPGRFILKPPPTDRRFSFREDMPANEYLTMHLAKEVYGIPVAANGLCYLGNGQAAYITRRFDYRPEGGKYHMEDFASLAGLQKERFGDNYKYAVLSYEDCADIIKRYCAAAVAELLLFYRQVVFNYLICNADAHLKNFSLVEYIPGDYRLSPAYDLLNTTLHIPSGIFALDKGLFKEGTPIGDTTPIGRPMLREFGLRIGLGEKTVGKELDFFTRNVSLAWEMIDGSSLSPQAKEAYRKDYKYRLSTMK